MDKNEMAKNTIASLAAEPTGKKTAGVWSEKEYAVIQVRLSGAGIRFQAPGVEVDVAVPELKFRLWLNEIPRERKSLAGTETMYAFALARREGDAVRVQIPAHANGKTYNRTYGACLVVQCPTLHNFLEGVGC